ncbi:MAG: hypothetical protein ACJ8F7_17850 [Gemmataceae bacterium]
MSRSLLVIVATLTLTTTAAADAPLEAGFGAVDITPALGHKLVYIAGFGNGRVAVGVADPLFARAVVLRQKKKIAIVSLDVVGFFFANVERVRQQLPGFDYVLVCSTHNHEGPDTLGLWGKTRFVSGVDPAYMKLLEERAAKAVKAAETDLRPVTAVIGSAAAPELLHDGREPIIKHDELVALRFTDATTNKPAGVIVQWNCHPETLGDKNTKISADYIGYTVKEVATKQRCPVVYLTGTVGGLMTSLHVSVKDASGQELPENTYEKTERYGQLLADVANRALDRAKPVKLTPFDVRRAEVYLPVDNKGYLLGRQIGVLQREAYVWVEGGTPTEVAKIEDTGKKRFCMKSEVGRLRLGQLDIAAIPGEIYPELVLDEVPDPAPDGADFPDAPVEPAIYKQLAGPYRMMVGLANDEIGYIIPKRQWDEKPPYTYGRKSAPYGEINSLGPDTAPLLCEAFRKLATKK